MRVGFGKDKYGFSSDLSVNINGKEYTADLEYTNKVGGVVSYIDFEIDPTIIKNTNTITVSIPEKGGKILSVQLTNDYLKGKPVGVDTSPLENLILDAKDKIDGVKISSTGKELKAGDRYVPSDVMNSYTLVIEKAEIVFKDNIASRDEVEDSIEELKNIGKMFERNIKAI